METWNVENKVRANVVCAICHETSHLTKDCPLRHDKKKVEESRKRDAAYLAFLDELEGKTPSKRIEETPGNASSMNSTDLEGRKDEPRGLVQAETNGRDSVQPMDSGVSPMEIDSPDSRDGSANGGTGESEIGVRKEGETIQVGGNPMPMMMSVMPMMPMLPFMAPPPVSSEQQAALMHNMRNRMVNG